VTGGHRFPAGLGPIERGYFAASGKSQGFPKLGTKDTEAGGLQFRKESVGKTAALGFGILRRRKTDPFVGPWKHLGLQTRLDLAFRGGRAYITTRPENENGNSG
jgi:hypothetical protein